MNSIFSSDIPPPLLAEVATSPSQAAAVLQPLSDPAVTPPSICVYRRSEPKGCISNYLKIQIRR